MQQLRFTKFTTLLLIFLFSIGSQSIIGQNKKEILSNIKALETKLRTLENIILDLGIYNKSQDTVIYHLQRDIDELYVGELELIDSIRKLSLALNDSRIRIFNLENSPGIAYSRAIEAERENYLYDAEGIHQKIVILYPTSEEAKLSREKIRSLNIVIADQEQRAKLARSEANVDKIYDEFDKITEYSDRRGNQYVYDIDHVLAGDIRVRLSFEVSDTSLTPKNLLFFLGYRGDKWLYLERIILIVDGEFLMINNDFKSEALPTAVYEWYETPIDSQNVDLVTKIKDAQEVKVRFEGRDNIRDFRIRSSQKEGLENILKHYFRLGGILPRGEEEESEDPKK